MDGEEFLRVKIILNRQAREFPGALAISHPGGHQFVQGFAFLKEVRSFAAGLGLQALFQLLEVDFIKSAVVAFDRHDDPGLGDAPDGPRQFLIDGAPAFPGALVFGRDLDKGKLLIHTSVLVRAHWGGYFSSLKIRTFG